MPQDVGYYPELYMFLKHYDGLPGEVQAYYEADYSGSTVRSVDHKYFASHDADEVCFTNQEMNQTYYLDNNNNIYMLYDGSDFFWN